MAVVVVQAEQCNQGGVPVKKSAMPKMAQLVSIFETQAGKGRLKPSKPNETLKNVFDKFVQKSHTPLTGLFFIVTSHGDYVLLWAPCRIRVSECYIRRNSAKRNRF